MKKLLTLLLTALLLLGSLPISAVAQENGSSDALTGDCLRKGRRLLRPVG